MKIDALDRIQLSKNFYLDEFVNTMDGNKVKGPSRDLIEALQKVRDVIGEMTITSGYRTERFNKSVGGSPKSFHLTGEASDFKANFQYWNKNSLIALFKASGFTNVKFYYRSKRLVRCHVDVGQTWNGKEFCVLSDKHE